MKKEEIEKHYTEFISKEATPEDFSTKKIGAFMVRIFEAGWNVSQKLSNENQERSRILLKATKDILDKCNEGSYVKDVFEQTAIWDEAECDGGCLLDEIGMLLSELSK